MKKIITILLLSTILSCCNKDENTTSAPTPVSQLPPATQTGANTVGCLVNGEAFLPYESNPFGTPAVVCFYQFLNGNYVFSLGFSNDKQERLRGVNIASNNVTFQNGIIYQIKSNNLNNVFGTYYNFLQTDFTTTDLVSGELKITKLDETNAIISGTFWFDAINSTGTRVEIREGRFDMKYSL